MAIPRINKTPEEIQEELQSLRAKLDAMPSRNKKTAIPRINKTPEEIQEELQSLRAKLDAMPSRR